MKEKPKKRKDSEEVIKEKDRKGADKSKKNKDIEDIKTLCLSSDSF